MVHAEQEDDTIPNLEFTVEMGPEDFNHPDADPEDVIE